MNPSDYEVIDGEIVESYEYLVKKMKLKKEKEKNMANPKKVKELFKTMTHNEIFEFLDIDGNGIMTFNEFKKLLPMLEIKMNEAKIFRIFSICDFDGSGFIDIDEFKVAMYTVDPSSGNPNGLSTSILLTPMDAFETFDEYNTGVLDEDELHYALDFLGLKLSEYVQETHFNRHDTTNQLSIDLNEFREIFLESCDLDKELENRYITLSSSMKRAAKINVLRELLLDEEDRDRKAISESKRYREWILRNRERKKYIRRAKWRAEYELKKALDGGGQVYVFGSGAYGQFGENSRDNFRTQGFEFQHFNQVLTLWHDRIKPEKYIERESVDTKTREHEEKRHMSKDDNKMINEFKRREAFINPMIDATSSVFKGLNVLGNTASLWCRNVHHVTISDNVIFAISENGVIYCWGGNNHMWSIIQPGSLYERKFRGDMTPRSQMLMGVSGREVPFDVFNAKRLESQNNSNNNNKAVQMQHMSESVIPQESIAVVPSMEMNLQDINDKRDPAEVRKILVMKAVCKYYGVWEPPPSPETVMYYLDKELLPLLEYNKLVNSLNVRGKHVEKLSKYILVEKLFECIYTERKILGDDVHKQFRTLDKKIMQLRLALKEKEAFKLQKEIVALWKPLHEIQEKKKKDDELAAEEKIKAMLLKKETDYDEYRKRLALNLKPVQSANIPDSVDAQIQIQGITPRGPVLHTPRREETGIKISAGANHVCLVNRSGMLYSWGVGGSGVCAWICFYLIL